MKQKIICVLFLCVFFLLISAFSVCGIIVSPSRLEVDYLPNEEVALNFNVVEFGEYGLNVAVEGQFADQATIITDTKSCVKNCEIKAKLKIPQFDENNPGRKSLMFYFTEAPPSASEGNPIASLSRIGIEVFFIVPYPGKYAEVTAKATDAKSNPRNNFQLDEKIYLSALVKNYGQQTISSVIGKMRITAPDNTIIAEIPLSSAAGLQTGETGVLSDAWLPENISRGLYHYTALINYDGKNAESSSVNLELGDRLVDFINFVPPDLIAKEINKVDFTLKNWWSSSLSCYVVGELFSLEGKVLTNSKSSSEEINARDQIQSGLFLDLTSVQEGNYTLKLTTYFGDGLSWSGQYPVTVKNKEIVENVPVVESNNNAYLFVLAGVLLIVIIGAIYYFQKKNDSERSNEL